jgi:hypothetical protein
MFAGQNSWFHKTFLASGIRLFLDSHRRRYFDRIDSKLRTNDFAVMAINALVGFGRHRRVVAFAVELVRELQDFLGAEFDAVAASFAPVVNDTDLAPGYLYLLRVKRFSPKCHVDYL